ncbi:hypothetical protein ACHAXT_006865 [Thalassiosira profunda]
MSHHFRLKLLLAAAATSAGCSAFSPEIFNQVLVQLGSTFTDGQIQICPDELAFAAANLLDVNQRRRAPISLLTTPSPRKKEKDDDGSMVELPRLAPSVYDYETQSIPGYLDLTPQEEALMQFLQAVRKKYSRSTTIRIAGGWVRDKLVYGKETPSRDVDLVLSNISGKDFADLVCKYTDEVGADDIRIERPAGKKGGAADQLQTATLLINGFDVDFAALRTEKYQKQSRIPTSAGTASVVQDAWRRDLTINALYYNLNSNAVEDWTEGGIRDLVLQRIATPKKPLPTLLQDPIRILRAVRFAAQLSFDFSPELLRAARDERVRSALQSKVSRDATGSAIDDMLGTRARDPCRGIQLLLATKLIDVAFPLSEQCDPAIYRVGLRYLSRTQSLVTRIFVQSPELEWNIANRRFLWYAAFLKPVYELMTPNVGSKRGRRESSFYQLLDALKRPKGDVQSIESILKGAKTIQTTVLMEARTDAVQSAVRSGADLRSVTPQSSQWKELSELRWMIYQALVPIGALWKEAAILALASSQRDVNVCVDQFKDTVHLIEDQLHIGGKIVPLLNGAQVQQYLDVSGKEFRRVIEAMEEWQIRNVCDDLDGIDEDARKRVESRLVAHLLSTFPRYAREESPVAE